MGVYEFIGKNLYRLALPGLILVRSRLGAPRTRVLVLSPSGRVLLVKTWFGRQRWSLPGGGIDGHETAEQSAARELEEEAAIKISPDELKPLGEFKGSDDLPQRYLVFVHRVDSERLDRLPRGRQYEIIGRQWCEPSALPANTAPVVRWALEQRSVVPDQ